MGGRYSVDDPDPYIRVQLRYPAYQDVAKALRLQLDAGAIGGDLPAGALCARRAAAAVAGLPDWAKKDLIDACRVLIEAAGR